MAPPCREGYPAPLPAGDVPELPVCRLRSDASLAIAADAFLTRMAPGGARGQAHLTGRCDQVRLLPSWPGGA